MGRMRVVTGRSHRLLGPPGRRAARRGRRGRAFPTRGGGGGVGAGGGGKGSSGAKRTADGSGGGGDGALPCALLLSGLKGSAANAAAAGESKPPDLPLSIVIPVMNEEACIGATLRYLALLDPAPLEIIVVDGGSTDGTCRLAAKAKGVKLIRTSQRSRAKQMNAGAAVARGECIMFLHADTLPPLDSAVLVSAAFRDPAVALAAFRPILEHRGRTFWGVSALHHVKTTAAAFLFSPVAALQVRELPSDSLPAAKRKKKPLTDSLHSSACFFALAAVRLLSN